MIGVATGAIPIYVALVVVAVGRDLRPSTGAGAVLTLGITLAVVGVFYTLSVDHA